MNHFWLMIYEFVVAYAAARCVAMLHPARSNRWHLMALSLLHTAAVAAWVAVEAGMWWRTGDDGLRAVFWEHHLPFITRILAVGYMTDVAIILQHQEGAVADNDYLLESGLGAVIMMCGFLWGGDFLVAALAHIAGVVLIRPLSLFMFFRLKEPGVQRPGDAGVVRTVARLLLVCSVAVRCVAIPAVALWTVYARTDGFGRAQDPRTKLFATASAFHAALMVWGSVTTAPSLLAV